MQASHSSEERYCEVHWNQVAKNNGVFIPLGFQQNHPMFFAVDNTDLKVGTPDGTNQLHGTAIAAY